MHLCFSKEVSYKNYLRRAVYCEGETLMEIVCKLPAYLTSRFSTAMKTLEKCLDKTMATYYNTGHKQSTLFD